MDLNELRVDSAILWLHSWVAQMSAGVVQPASGKKAWRRPGGGTVGSRQ